MSRRARIFLVVLAGIVLTVTAAKAASDSQVIFPGGTPGTAAPAAKPADGFGFTTLLGVIVLAGAGGWILWRNKKVNLGNRDARLLVIDETRPLGNRQYLVVASYEGKKFLLGVCPGRIDLLAPLGGSNAKEDAR